MRLLALVPPGTNARSIYCDMLRGVQRAGHSVFFEDIAAFVAAYQRASAANDASGAGQTGTLYARHLESLAATLRCEAMVTLGVDGLMAMPWVAAADGRPVSFVELIRLPVVHYWLDAPFWAYGGQLLPALDRSRFTSRYHIHVVNNEGTAEEMRRVLGFQTVIAQPYGVDEATFRPWVGQARAGGGDYELAICCGPGDPAPSAAMREELAKDEPDLQRVRRAEAGAVRSALVDGLSGLGASPHALAALAEAWLAEQLADPDRPMLTKLDAAAARVQAPVRAEAAQIAARLTSEPGSAARWASVTAMVRRVDSWQRAFTTTYLSRQFRSLWLGAGAVALEQAGWPIRGDRTGFLEYHEMAVAYGRASTAVSVMRYQDDVGLNPKGLEVAASGAVAMQRWRLGAERQLAAGIEGLWFASPADGREQLRSLLGTAKRDQIAAAGRERVVREHTWTVKAGEMMQRIGAAIDAAGLGR